MNEHSESAMSAAEFRTAHDALGVSAAFLADRMGIHEQNVWRYEATDRVLPVPEHASATMRQLVTEFEHVAQEIAKTSRKGGVIERHTDLTEFESTWPTMAGWGPRAQGLVISRASEIAQLGVEYA